MAEGQRPPPSGATSSRILARLHILDESINLAITLFRQRCTCCSTREVDAMSFCPRCGTQVEAEASCCPNCGAAITQPADPHEAPEPQVASRVRAYFSIPFLYCILVSSIVIFAVVLAGGRLGEQVTIEQASQILIEVEDEFRGFTALDIFIHNVRIALISMIPIIGAVWMVIVQYSTGYLIGAIAKAYDVNFGSLLWVTLRSPTGLLEYSAYILALSESFVLVYAMVTKHAQRRLRTQTWKTVVSVMGLLMLSAVAEAISLGRPLL
ncbi:MAG: stage II sporulation protein M [Candidatus Bathyarchaeota archaeon]|nr:MAG: stage II sporulation protein M [Candidatus Bathyarchaeota archaeon]